MKLNIAVLPGDGIGPEIVEQGMKAVKAVCEKYGDVYKRQCLFGSPGRNTRCPHHDQRPGRTGGKCTAQQRDRRDKRSSERSDKRAGRKDQRRKPSGRDLLDVYKRQ